MLIKCQQVHSPAARGPGASVMDAWGTVFTGCEKHGVFAIAEGGILCSKFPRCRFAALHRWLHFLSGVPVFWAEKINNSLVFQMLNSDLKNVGAGRTYICKYICSSVVDGPAFWPCTFVVIGYTPALLRCLCEDVSEPLFQLTQQVFYPNVFWCQCTLEDKMVRNDLNSVVLCDGRFSTCGPEI